ncbi:MAG: AmmeMemoRadiSam system protein B [Ignavibacteriae bacterium]|nr:AmmeMemoRadiSam system protein B [Ignavibacteriota bacterium]
MRTFLMKYLGLIILMVALSNTFCQDSPDTDKITHRPPTVAGAFYPADADTIKKWINEYLSADEPLLVEGDIIGLVVPHAGYVYSGWVAGKAYRELKGRKYDDVIVISPSHSKAFRGASVFKSEAYVTPLGVAKVDLELSKEIANVFTDVKFSLDGHSWSEGRAEHALEVQIPFLQIIQSGTPIVPIVMGTQDFETTDELVKAIVQSVKKLNRKVLLIASSDLSHFHTQKQAEKIDSPLVKAFSKLDYFKIAMNLYQDKWEACGGAPITVVMSAAEQLGANSAKTFLYASSASSPYTATDTSRVVGYFSGALYNDNSGQLKILPDLTDEDKKVIMEIAKKAVKSAVLNSAIDVDESKISERLNDEYASFVTLKEDGMLRGCMGQTFTTSSLINSVIEAGRLASTRDPRFNPVSEKELNKLEYEVTVLSRMKKILDPEEIVVGRDGVYIRLENSGALFLPQVAPEQKWDRTELLENLCRKARLPNDAYKSTKAELYVFQAMIID